MLANNWDKIVVDHISLNIQLNNWVMLPSEDWKEIWMQLYPVETANKVYVNLLSTDYCVKTLEYYKIIQSSILKPNKYATMHKYWAMSQLTGVCGIPSLFTNFFCQASLISFLTSKLFTKPPTKKIYFTPCCSLAMYTRFTRSWTVISSRHLAMSALLKSAVEIKTNLHSLIG